MKKYIPIIIGVVVLLLGVVGVLFLTRKQPAKTADTNNQQTVVETKIEDAKQLEPSESRQFDELMTNTGANKAPAEANQPSNVKNKVDKAGFQGVAHIQDGKLRYLVGHLGDKSGGVLLMKDSFELKVEAGGKVSLHRLNEKPEQEILSKSVVLWTNLAPTHYALTPIQQSLKQTASQPPPAAEQRPQ